MLEMKTVVPFNLSNDWNLITRTTKPVIQVPDLAPDVDGTSGVGDVQLGLSPALRRTVKRLATVLTCPAR